MKAAARVLAKLYSAVVRLYPYRFRAAFGLEMEEVFANLMHETLQAGPRSVIALCCRELRDLPVNLIREHWLAQKERPMGTCHFKHFALIAGMVLALDWVMGALCASGRLPLWVFLLPNLPFGLLYVGLESSWTGTHYEFLGHVVGDTESLLVFLFVVIAQSAFYFALFNKMTKKRGTAPAT